MSTRDRDRERERASRSQPSAAARTNEYFVPRDGIDREVITADICRYLGNDALVRPGTYENPTTGVIQPGYFINAYRNLTTAMIADLKADSARWEAERSQTASRGQPLNGISSRDSDGMARNSNTPIVEYRSSTTHQSRQYYGPTEGAAPAAVSQAYSSAPSYQSAGASAQQGVYDNGYQPQCAQQAPVYADPGYNAPSEYYVAGADLTVDQRSGRAPLPQSVAVPRTGQQVQYAASYQQPDARNFHAYAGQSAPSPVSYTQGSAQQPSDPYYGRGAPQTGTYGEASPGIYDSRAYQDSQPHISSTTASSGSSRRDRDRESDRDSRHHRSSRR